MWLFGIGVALQMAGGLASLVLHTAPRVRSRLAAGSVILGSLCAVASAIGVLVSGEAVSVHGAWAVPLGSFSLSLDALSAVFVLPIAIVSAGTAVYGCEYLDRSSKTHASPTTWFFFNFLAATMLLVVAARNGVLFLACWEGMSLASFFLVLTERDEDSVRRSAWIYLVAMHLGTACLLALFLLLSRGAASLDFAAFSAPPLLVGTLFLLALVGFGTKAGLVPLHVWLPEAHPAAPSHVSALMSGVMIKTGVYGLLRTIGILPSLPAWCGWLLVAVGLASAVLGILFAIAQRDLKRLLAYSSVENIGIIVLGIGVGLLGVAYRIPAMAALGLLGALFHVVNHALLKTILFLGAGSVQQGAGTRDLERLGGLLKRQPVTGCAFLIGACGIAGLPPLNGFLSELLIVLGVLTAVTDQALSIPAGATALCVLVVGGIALVSGLASACFVRAFGCVFLGEPRSEEAARANGAGPAMQWTMVALAACCGVVALTAPAWPFVFRAAIVSAVPRDCAAAVSTTVGNAFVPLAATAAASWGLVAVAVLVAWARRKLLCERRVAAGPTWDCGYAFPRATMQYTGSSFASPLTTLFRIVLRPLQHWKEPQGEFPSQGHFTTSTPDLFAEYVYRPLFASVAWSASRLRRFQQGRIQLYVLYIALTILWLLIWKLD